MVKVGGCLVLAVLFLTLYVGAVPKTVEMLGDSNAESLEWNTLNPLRFALNAMGATLANVENAPLRLNALVLHNSFATPETILGT